MVIYYICLPFPMNKSHTGRIVSNFFALSIIQGTNLLIPILVMPHVIQRIGVGAFGAVSIAQVIMIYLSTVSDYGFSQTATRSIALNKTKDEISGIFFTVLTTKMIITVLSFLLMLILILFIPFFQSNAKLYLSGFTYVIGQSLLVTWFFQGVEKMKFITFSVLLARIIFAILVFVFIRQEHQAYLFLFFLGIGNIIAGLFSIYVAIYLFRLKFVYPQWLAVIGELKNGWQIMISNIFMNTYLYINIFILRIFAGDLIVGYYSIAEKIFLAIRQLLSIFSQAIYPHICQLTQSGKKQTTLFFKQLYIPFLLLLSVGCCAVFILSLQITQLFAGKGSGLPGLLLRMLSFVPVIVCLNIPANLLLLSFNQKKSYLQISTLGTIVNICANLLLANFWGAQGTAVAIIITEVFIAIGLNMELYRNNLSGYLGMRNIGT